MDSLSLFIAQFYWIDVTLILCLVAGYYILIQRNASRILANNTKYNAELRAMRTEIYMEYERNFFL